MWNSCTFQNNQTFKNQDIPYFLTWFKIIFFCNLKKYSFLLACDRDIGSTPCNELNKTNETKRKILHIFPKAMAHLFQISSEKFPRLRNVFKALGSCRVSIAAEMSLVWPR